MSDDPAERDPAGSGAVSFGVLGPTQACGPDGRTRSLGGPRQRAVLAHLLIRAGQVVPMDVLVDLLWGEDGPRSARSVIQTYVSHLRDSIGSQRIVHEPPGYRLDVAPGEVDSRRFEALVEQATSELAGDPANALALLDEALALWRGPAFADLADDAAIGPHAAHLDAARLGAQEARIEALLGVGAATRAVEAAERLLADHPYHEQLWASLMLGLYREARQRDALDAYLRLRRLLGRELGVEPSPPLADLQQRILRQDPSLAGPPSQIRGYRLGHAIGEGRLGSRSLAVDTRTGRQVVIETVRPRLLGTPGFVRRFDIAVRVVSQLEHPAICPVVDAWRDDAGAWVVTAALAGPSLREFVEMEPPRPDSAVVPIVESVAAALDHAHRAGATHGDISSDHVHIDTDGHAIVSGFWMGQGPRPQPREDILALEDLARRLLPGLSLTADPIDAEAVAVAARETAGMVSTARPSIAGRGRNPYKGLRSFQEPDQADFHGREALVRRVVERLREPGTDARFLALVGPSGAGKSSLIAAGVLPAVRAGGLWPVDRSWVIGLSADDHPCSSLETALRSSAARPRSALRAYRAGGTSALRDALDAGLPPGAGCLLVIDRFEDLFVEGPGSAERERFLVLLEDALTGAWDRLAVLVAVRADRYDLPLRHATLGGRVASHTEPVPPLSPEGLEHAIRCPAEAAGVEVGPGLLAALVADTTHQAGGQPFLQFTLSELFERRTDGAMTLDAYRAMDGLVGALTSSADELLGSLGPRRERVAREVLLRLVLVGDGPPRVRHAVRRSELERPDLPLGDIDDVVELFGRHRLLTTDRDPITREPTVELAHEALIAGWRTLHTWVIEATDDLVREDALARVTAEWLASGRDPSFLLRGSRLEQTETWAAGTDLSLSDDQRTFLAASNQRRTDDEAAARAVAEQERARERRGRSRLRAAVAGLIGLSVIAGSTAVIAVNESDRSRMSGVLADIRQLAAAAIASVDDDPERGLLLAHEAAVMAHDAHMEVPAEVEQALHDTLAASRPAFTLEGGAGQVAFGSDGSVVATGADPVGTLSLRDPASGAPGRQVRLDAAIEDVAISPDGASIAVALATGAMVVLDAAELGERFRVIGSGYADGVSWSSAGMVAAAWPEEGTVRVMDAASGQVVGLLHRPEATDTALAPDGRSIAVAATDVAIMDLEHPTRRPTRLTPVAPISGAAYIVSDVAWSPDGRWIATASMSGTDLWDAHSVRHVTHLGGHTAGVASVAWAADPTRLVTGGDDGTVRGWEVRPDDVASSWTMRAQAVQGGSVDVSVDPTGSRVIAAGPGGTVVWAVAHPDDRDATVLPAVGFYGDVAFLPGDAQVVGVGRGGRLTVWGLATGARDRTLGPPLAEHWFDVAPDGSAIAVGGIRTMVMELATGATRSLPGHADAELDWSPDGDQLVIGATILDRADRVLGSLELEGYVVREPRYSPDGASIVTSGDTPSGPLVVIWDRRTLRPLRTIAATTMDVAIDPSGRFLATDGSPSDPPAIWELATGRKIRSLGTTAAFDVAFSPDGSRVAVARADGLIRLYDTATGAEVLVLRGHRADVRTVVFDSTGDHLASQGPGEIRLWTLDVDELLARAERETTRGLSGDECQRFLHRACPLRS